MSEFDRALNDIRRIRQQVADSTEFRGYGPATLASTAVMAAVAAVVQQQIVPHPETSTRAYLGLWIGTAIIAGLVSAIQMATRSRRMHSTMSSTMIRMAVQQFLPALVVGLLFTVVFAAAVPASQWLLPGIWQIFFSLGIASSCRFLPRSMLAPAVWYLGTGLAAVAIGNIGALSPWVMGVSFTVGQLLIAAVLYLHNGEEHPNA